MKTKGICFMAAMRPILRTTGRGGRKAVLDILCGIFALFMCMLATEKDRVAGQVWKIRPNR